MLNFTLIFSAVLHFIVLFLDCWAIRAIALFARDLRVNKGLSSVFTTSDLTVQNGAVGEACI